LTTPSIVQQSFAEARRKVADWQAENPERGVAITLAVPSSPHNVPVAPCDPPTPKGPLHQALRDMSERRVTSVDLVQTALQAAEDASDLNGMAHLDASGALAHARKLDEEATNGLRRGPLHGIPMTVKDVIHVAGMPTGSGSNAYDRTPETDPTAVTRLRQAGAIILGKATTHEFALGVTTPQAHHPDDPTRIPGGSSGGSVIGIRRGIGLASLGTDTRASLRNPSALSGTVGFKPTFGTVPTDGVITLSWTMDHLGPIAATVADAALVLDTLIEPSPGLVRYAGASIDGLRVGVPRAAFENCEPLVAQAVENALQKLAALGVKLVDIPRPSAEDFQLANYAGLLVSRSEAATFHQAIGTDPALCTAEIRDQLEEAARIPAKEYLAAQRYRGQLQEEFLALFDDIDAMAMPTSPVVAPRTADADRYFTVLSRNCIPWSFIGFPAVSLPCQDRAYGLPVGLQLAAPPHHEATLVALGTAYEG